MDKDKLVPIKQYFERAKSTRLVWVNISKEDYDKDEAVAVGNELGYQFQYVLGTSYMFKQCDETEIVGEIYSNQMRGIYMIVDVFPEKNKRRIGRSVIFPEAATTGSRLTWYYVAGGILDKYAGHLGLHVHTTVVTSIQKMGEQFQISTESGAQYVFERVI